MSDAEVQEVVAALQTQVRRDFGPAWGVAADVAFVPGSGEPPAGAWWMAVLDNSDAAGALGYHDLTDHGLPLAKVFAGTDRQYGTSWTVSASHELLEMLLDPDINLSVLVEQSGAAGRLYAYEACDACEDDRYGYRIGNVLVSDFVCPAWFESFWAEGAATFDFRKQMRTPFELLPGGYISVMDVGAGSGWQQIFAAGAEAKSRAPVGSRRERRQIGRPRWLRSATAGREKKQGPGVKQPGAKSRGEGGCG